MSQIRDGTVEIDLFMLRNVDDVVSNAMMITDRLVHPSGRTSARYATSTQHKDCGSPGSITHPQCVRLITNNVVEWSSQDKSYPTEKKRGVQGVDPATKSLGLHVVTPFTNAGAISTN